MPRTVHVLPFVGTKERLWNQIYFYMSMEGFDYVNYDGEWVFQKGEGWVTAPSFFKVEFTQTEAVVQAWIKTAVAPKVFVGESGLDSAYGFAVKGKLNTAVALLEPLIQTGMVPPVIPADPPAAPVAPPVYTQPAFQPPYQQPPYQQPVYQQPAPQPPYQQPYPQPAPVPSPQPPAQPAPVPAQPQAQPQPTAQPAFCRQCGTPTNGRAFCSKCGYRHGS